MDVEVRIFHTITNIFNIFRKEIDDLSPEEFHGFNRKILDAYLHWKESGKKGFYMETYRIPEYRRNLSMYTID